jgi:hypothetical protein
MQTIARGERTALGEVSMSKEVYHHGTSRGSGIEWNYLDTCAKSAFGSSDRNNAKYVR